MGDYFYEDEDKKERLKEELLTTEAKKWAKSFINPKFPAGPRDRNPKLTSAQLRRFHMEAKTLETRAEALQAPEKDFLSLSPIVKMLKSKVAYACPVPGRDKKVPEEFRRYIEEMVDHIDDYKDFKAFCLCFEAVVGFFYGEGGR